MAGHGSLIQTYWLHPRAWNQRKLHAQNLPVCKAACKVVVAKESDWPFEKCEEKKNTRCFGDTDTVWFFLLWSIVLSLVRDVWVLLCIYIYIHSKTQTSRTRDKTMLHRRKNHTVSVSPKHLVFFFSSHFSKGQSDSFATTTLQAALQTGRFCACNFRWFHALGCSQ